MIELKAITDAVFYTFLISAGILGLIFAGCTCEKYIISRIIMGLLFGAFALFVIVCIVLKVLFAVGVIPV